MKVPIILPASMTLSAAAPPSARSNSDTKQLSDPTEGPSTAQCWGFIGRCDFDLTNLTTTSTCEIS
jgi:hypothetical protein